MISRRVSWLIGMAGLMLLLAGLGCSVCPLVPQLPTATPSPLPPPADTPTPEATPTPRSTPTSEPTFTPETPSGMELYANPAAGFRILYPEDWVYEEESTGVFFAKSEEALGVAEPSEAPLVVILAGAPEDIEDLTGAAATPQELLDVLQESLCATEENCETGDVETWTFGETPGVGQELSWSDPQAGVSVRGYLVVALSDEVAGIGFAGSPAGDYASLEQTFQDMFDSLEFFPPQEPEPAERGEIQPGETVEGTLPPNGVEVWSFEAQAGQYITIRLDAVDAEGLDTYLKLYDADEVLLTEDDDGGEGTNSAIGEFPVVDSGTYYIYASAYSGQGDYTLGLEIADEPSGGGEIGYGDTVEGTLGSGVEHGWVFEGKAGDAITIAMNATDDALDCYLELYGPDDTMLADDDDGGEGFNALIADYVLSSDGTYRIVARGSMGSAGTYELSLEQVELRIEGTLDYGDEVSATLDPGARHYWLFEGDEGDVVTISMTAVDLDSYLELFAPSGERVMTDDDSGGNSNAEISAFELPESGTYRILARGYGSSDEGAYELTLTGP